MARTIAVVTGTRAEFGILQPLLRQIKNSDGLELMLIVTGLHLLEKYGQTVKEVRRGGFKIDGIVDMYAAGKEDDPTYHGEALAKGINGFTKLLSSKRPDILVVLGDRLEGLAAVLAAATLRIPIAHIHGGDKTDSGHIDESIRHSITRFAHIHFTATKQSSERLKKTGEEHWRIFNVGALGLDSILNMDSIPREKLAKKLAIQLNKEFIVCVFHPVHLEKEASGEQMREILEAIKTLKMPAVVLYPNNDAGTEGILKEIRNYGNSLPITVFPSISPPEYISLLRYAGVLIGNSSSGIIEAPSLKLPVVNIGSRNVGREHAKNVIYVPCKKDDITKAIRKALFDKKFRKKVRHCKSPYGNGKASGKILRVLIKTEINKKLLKKKITY